MHDLAIDNACHKSYPAEWAEVVSGYEHRPVTPPTAPFRDIDQWFHDGPPPSDGRISARLAVPSQDAAEEYWLWVDLIRPGKLMTCSWSMEERFDLPAPPHATRWRLELLPDRLPTADGGSRRTRISPL